MGQDDALTVRWTDSTHPRLRAAPPSTIRVCRGPAGRGTTPTGRTLLNRRTLLTAVSALVVCLIGAAAVALTRPASAEAAIDTRAMMLQAQNDALRAQLQAERRTHAKVTTRLRARAESADGPDVGSVDHALTIAATTYGVPLERLRRVATCESTLNPEATNGPYVGLFQFGTPLWNSTPYGDMSRTDPYAASLAAAKTFSEGGASHWPVCGS